MLDPSGRRRRNRRQRLVPSVRLSLTHFQHNHQNDPLSTITENEHGPPAPGDQPSRTGVHSINEDEYGPSREQKFLEKNNYARRGTHPESFDVTGLSHSVVDVEDAAPEAVEDLEDDQFEIQLQQESSGWFSEWFGNNDAIFDTFEDPGQNDVEDEF